MLLLSTQSPERVPPDVDVTRSEEKSADRQLVDRLRALLSHVPFRVHARAAIQYDWSDTIIPAKLTPNAGDSLEVCSDGYSNTGASTAFTVGSYPRRYETRSDTFMVVK